MTGPTGDWQVPREYQGLGQPGVYVPHGYQPVYVVPRPPRPGVVTGALILTYIGVAVATLNVVVGLALAGAGNELTPLTVAAGPRPINVPVWVLVVVAVFIGLVLPATGAVVAAVFTARGSNAARIVLASLMGMCALANLCQGGGTLTGPDSGSAGAFIGAGLDLVLVGLAGTVGVLLLVPAAGAYFTPGPGRRFADRVTPVPSTHDRP
jgi:hypothetical protein